MCAFNLAHFFFIYFFCFKPVCSNKHFSCKWAANKEEKKEEKKSSAVLLKMSWEFGPLPFFFFGARRCREVDPCILEYVLMQMSAAQIARFLLVLKCKKWKIIITQSAFNPVGSKNVATESNYSWNKSWWVAIIEVWEWKCKLWNRNFKKEKR